MPYRDLQDYIAELHRQNLLQVIEEPVCKDTELMPLVRLQFRGLPEAQRKAFWFRNVTDARRRHFDASVLVGALGSSRAVYAAALGVKPEGIAGAWARAHGHPVAPVDVGRAGAPVKARVRHAPQLEGGIDS